MTTYSSKMITIQLKVMACVGLFLTSLLLLVVSLSLVCVDIIPIHTDLGSEYTVKVIIALAIILIANIWLCRFCKKLTTVVSNGEAILLDAVVVDVSRVVISEVSVLGYNFGRIMINENKSFYFVPKKDFIKYRRYFATSNPKNASIKDLCEKINVINCRTSRTNGDRRF